MHLFLPALKQRPSAVLTYIFICLVFISGCGKDKTEPKSEPAAVSVETTLLNFTSPVSADVTGKVLNIDKQKIVDHGFVYGYTDDLSINKSTKISLGADFTSGFFTAKITDLQPPPIFSTALLLVVKAYVTDKSGTYYGQTVSTNYKGDLKPVLDQDGGKAGDQVSIRGNFSGIAASSFKVSFGNVAAKIILVSDNAVKVEVPKGLQVYHGQAVPVNVQAGMLTSASTPYFTVWANITDINPKSGPIGTKITFTGDNLPVKKEFLTLSFGNAFATWDYDGSYSVRIPEGVASERTKICLYRNNDRVEGLEFTVTPHVVKSVTPNPARLHDKLKIHLENTALFSIRGRARVNIGYFSYLVYLDENGDLTVDTGDDLAVGVSYPVSVTSGPHQVDFSVPLTILP